MKKYPYPLEMAIMNSICKTYEEIHVIDPNTAELYFVTYTGHGVEWQLQPVDAKSYYKAQLKVRIHSNDREKIRESSSLPNLVKTFEKGESVYMEYRKLDNSGTYRWCAYQLIGIRWDDQEERRVLCLMKDIHGKRAGDDNQQQKLIDALMASERSHMKKIDFWSQLSHDGRTDLDGIMGLARLLQKNAEEDSAAGKQAAQIYELADHLLENLKKAVCSNNLHTEEFHVTQEAFTDYKFGNETILLAEDNPLSMEIARTVLQLKGMRVVSAANGEEAVELFEKMDPDYFDAILMDVNMPVMNGIDATKRIREMNREDAQSIPIFAMSANAFPESIQRCMENGMDGYFTKPVNMEQLYGILGRYLSQRTEQ